jgi:hypothetical protein
VLTGIDGFKTYMKTNDLDFLNISKLERTAIFACPAIEVAVSAIDFVVQLTTTIIASTYAGV